MNYTNNYLNKRFYFVHIRNVANLAWNQNGLLRRCVTR